MENYVWAAFVQVKSIIGNTILCDFRIVNSEKQKQDFEAKRTNLFLEYHSYNYCSCWTWKEVQMVDGLHIFHGLWKCD